MPDIYIAHRSRKNQRPLWVSLLPGEGGGVDYGYGAHSEGSPGSGLDGARCLTQEQLDAWLSCVTPLLARDESTAFLAVPHRPCTCTRSAKPNCPRSAQKGT